MSSGLRDTCFVQKSPVLYCRCIGGTWTTKTKFSVLGSSRARYERLGTFSSQSSTLNNTSAFHISDLSQDCQYELPNARAETPKAVNFKFNTFC